MQLCITKPDPAGIEQDKEEQQNIKHLVLGTAQTLSFSYIIYTTSLYSRWNDIKTSLSLYLSLSMLTELIQTMT